MCAVARSPLPAIKLDIFAGKREISAQRLWQQASLASAAWRSNAGRAFEQLAGGAAKSRSASLLIHRPDRVA